MASQSYGAVEDVYEANVPVTKRELKEMYRDQQSGEQFVQATIVMTSICVFLWIMPLFNGPWHAVGIDMGGWGKQMTLEASLFTVEVKFDCFDFGKTLNNINVFNGICKILDLLDLTGQKTVRDTMNRTCVISELIPFFSSQSPMCDFFIHYFLLTYAVFFASLIAVILQIIGVALLSLYWWHSPQSKLRMWGGYLLCAAPILPLLVGFFLWFIILVMNDAWNDAFQTSLRSMPGLSVFLTSLGGNFRPGYPRHLPWCYWVFCFNIALSSVTAMMWTGFSHSHMREEALEDMRALEKEKAANMHDEVMAGVMPPNDYEGQPQQPQQYSGGSYPGQQQQPYQGGAPMQQQYPGGYPGQQY